MLQFDSSIVSGELPIDTFLRSISLCIPNCKLLIKFFDIANTSFSQALVAKSREFNFSDIKPTPTTGRVSSYGRLYTSSTSSIAATKDEF